MTIGPLEGTPLPEASAVAPSVGITSAAADKTATKPLMVRRCRLLARRPARLVLSSPLIVFTATPFLIAFPRFMVLSLVESNC